MATTRRNFVRGATALAMLPPKFPSSKGNTPGGETELWFSKPATRWMEALPIGNGRIGGMVFGGTAVERIALSESTFWAGAPSDKNVPPTALSNLAPIRQLMFEGRYVEGAELCKEHLLGRPESFGTNLPMATVELKFHDDATVTRYRRSLDLDEAIAHVDYTAADRRFRREVFASHPDNVLVLRVSCSTKHSVTCELGFAKPPIAGGISVSSSDTLVWRGRAFEQMHSNGRQGVEAEIRVRVVPEGGTVKNNEEGISVTNADALTLLIAVATSFPGGKGIDDAARTLQTLKAKDFSSLRAAHVKDHQSLYRRVSIDLGENSSQKRKPTDVRRKAVENGETDPSLVSLFFQYGRYLTIAGSRSSSPLPLALQGIWNDGLASSMGWTDDYHLDINTEQNYWLAEVANLSECQTPLFSFVDFMSKAGRETASKMYGAPGWVSHVVTNPWGFTAAGWGLGWGIFPTGGVWLSLQLWQHYQFTRDKIFLRDRLFPIFKEAAEFFLAYMVKHPVRGWLVTGPSVSPENSFLTKEGKSCSESMGPTVDRVLVFALLSACIQASKELDLEEEFRQRAQSALKQLPPFQIGKHGQLQEWLEDFEEAQPNHRHTSHLIALYPEYQISPLTTPELAHAARITIERRVNQPNWEDAEWSRANMVNYYARLFDGNSAYRHLVGLLSKATEDSLLTYSRGGVAGAESNIFAIDGNCAGAAGIAEMLLQSHAGELHLLPALPSEWPEGKITGLKARGNIEVSLFWNRGRLEKAILKSRDASSYTVRYGAATTKINLTPDKELEITARQFS